MIYSDDLQEIAAFSIEELQKLFSEVFATVSNTRSSNDRITGRVLIDTFTSHVDQMLFNMICEASEDLIS